MASDIHQFTVQASQAGQRVDKLSAELFPQHSRHQWTSYGVFRQSREIFPAKTKVKTGESWTASYRPKTQTKSSEFSAEKISLIENRPDWVLAHKPAGISTHASASDHGPNLINTLEEQLQQPLYLVHRLDKPTSGLLLVAKTSQTADFFRQHWNSVIKEYRAVVSGVPPAHGFISGAIRRDPVRRERMMVTQNPDDRAAQTEFWSEFSAENCTALRIRIYSGRTHQIRAHLSSIGHSILGDDRYGGPPTKTLALQAFRLTFPDPQQPTKSITHELAPPNFWKRLK